MVSFTSPATGAVMTNLQARGQISAYAYPDFCATVDGSTDNTTCLTAGLAATGLNFSTLELPALGTTTAVNYVCTSLGLIWPNPTARIHIWKGATVSCAFPPADATHIVQDDNLAPIIPYAGSTFPSTNGGAVSTCTSGCSAYQYDMTATGTYTGTTAGNFCVKISSTGSPDQISWGMNAASDEQVNQMNCSSFGTGSVGTNVSLGSGIYVTFADLTGHNTNDTWAIAVTPAGANPGYVRSVSVPPVADVLCAHGSDASISGVVCLNAADATTETGFQTSATMPANLWASNRALRVTAQFSVWSSPTASSTAAFNLVVNGATKLASTTTAIVPPNSLTGTGASATWLVVGTPAGAGDYLTQPLVNSLPGATAALTANATAQPVSAGTAAFNIGVSTRFGTNPGGLGGTIVYSSCGGCTIPSGSGSCTATASGGTGTGAAGIITASGGSFSGQHVIITSPGYGYTAAVNSWGISGTSCFGTMTTTGTALAGAQGNAIQLQSLIVEQIN